MPHGAYLLQRGLLKPSTWNITLPDFNFFFPPHRFTKYTTFRSSLFVPLTLFSLFATVSTSPTSDCFYGRLELGSLYPSFKSNANYFLLTLILSPTFNFMGTLVFLPDRFYFIFERSLLAKHRRYSHTIAIRP